jgi:cytochrome c-type biogenesis protein CcmH
MRSRVAFFSLCEKKATRLPALVALAALSVSVLAVPASATTPQTTLPDVEDEVMCPICGELLQLAESPQAQRERVFIRRQIAAGRSKSQIKDALVAQYGPAVLALPRGSGFDLSAYLVPAIAFLVALLALGAAVWRWRRRGRGGGQSGDGGPGTAAGPGAEDAARLDADLARYDL